MPNYSFIASFVCLLFCASASAENPVQLTAGQTNYPLGKSLRYLEVQGGVMELEMVLNNASKISFLQSEQDIPNFGFTDSSYWFRAQVRGDPRLHTRWILEIGYPLLDQLDVYFIHNGGAPEAFETGDLLPLERRPLKSRLFLFPLEAAPGELIDIYIHVQTESAMQLPIQLWEPTSFYEQEEPQVLLKAFVAGSLVIMFFYNLFLYFTIRDRSYLHYVGMVALMLTFDLALNGLGYRYLWNDILFINQKIVPLSISGLALTAGFFTQAFLNTKENAPKSHKTLSVMAAAAGLVFLLSFFASYGLTVRLATLVGGTISIACLIVGFIEMKAGYGPARYYTLAWFFLYGATVVLALSKFGIVDRTALVEQSFEFGTVLQVMLFSFALGDRINQIRKEKALAQETVLQQYEKYAQAMDRNETLRNENLKLQSADARSVDLLEMERDAFKSNSEIRTKEIQRERLANLGSLVSGMLHDFNNPLNQILTSHESLYSELSALETALLSNMAEDGASEATVKKLQKSFLHMRNMLEYIELASRRIDSMNKGFVTYARTSTDPVTNVNMDELVGITRQVVNSRIKSFQLDFDLAQVPKLTLCPSEICFVLSILMTNAADALEAVKAEHKDRRAFFDGKISVRVRAESKNESSGVLVCVEDNGGGISKEQWSSFIEPYMSTRSDLNSGLGLTICKALVQKNRGKMWLADDPMLGGAKIELFFPAG